MNWHAEESQELLKRYAVDPLRGLTEAEVEKLRDKYGRNVLPEGEKISIFKVFVHQFKSPLIYLLFFAALAAALMQEFSDAGVILAVVTLNALIGAFQEARAEQSMQDLKKVTSVEVRVLRDGSEEKMKASELVPGDIVLFNAGDAIPADCRLLEARSLQVSEAVLTGESVPVEKNESLLEADIPLGDRVNMLFSGTFISAGRARAVVVATGTHTEIGKIANLTGSVTEPLTPLNRKIQEFSRYLIYGSGIIFVLIIIVGYLQGMPLQEIVMVAISQVVSIVPEGLPVAITVAAAVGVQRMAKKRSIVRKLSAVETLGSTTVICSDKTGTLTLNQMVVQEIHPHETDEKELLLIAALCNDANVDEDGKHLGDPTESSLIVAAQRAGLYKGELDEKYPRLNEIPFESDTKMMATEHKREGRPLIALKGATDQIIELCDLSQEVMAKIKDQTEKMAQNALRVLAFAKVEGHHLNGSYDSLKGQVTFLGLMGQMDPPREEVKAAIAACKRAGIKPVMITGDHKTTGLAIAKMIGMAQEGDLALEGKEIEAATPEMIDRARVFARVHPSQKLKLVEGYQAKGHVVAMTGDGVNDAPALSRADVGVAMGITGTEVAKEASKIVITDDNFTTIVSAIAEGRLVFQNIKKAILLLFSTSVSEVIVLMLSLILGFSAPYSAVQILWNNLVTDGVITVNLIMEPAEGTEMDRRPISRDEPIINRIMLMRMFFIVPAIVICTFGWFVWRKFQGIDVLLARTETLTMLVVCQWFNALNCRSETQSALSWSILKNKWLIGGLLFGNFLHVLVVFWRPLGQYFHTVPISLDVIPLIAVIGSLVLWVEEIRKFFVRRQRKLA
jgi:calcium-translocating P-type ATPase